MSVALGVRALPARTLRSAFLSLSRRRALGRLATRFPITRAMVARFVAGEELGPALDAIERVRAAGLQTTVDVLGEAVTDPSHTRAAVAAYLATLDALANRGLDRNVSLKLSQFGLELDESLCRSNIAAVFERAAELGAFVRIDMEDHTTVDRALAIWREMRMLNPASGVVIQSALRRSAADVGALVAEGARIRLCKGAYNEPPAIAYQAKIEVDRSYATLMELLLRHGDYPALATHDERLIRRAIAFAEREGIGPDRFEFQMLYGVRRDLQERLVAGGHRVRVYVPYGGQWYPYFMRRLAERPANVAFLLRSILREGRGKKSDQP